MLVISSTDVSNELCAAGDYDRETLVDQLIHSMIRVWAYGEADARRCRAADVRPRAWMATAAAISAAQAVGHPQPAQRRAEGHTAAGGEEVREVGPEDASRPTHAYGNTAVKG